MGRILVEGKEAGALLEYLSTNHITSKPDFSATYTTWAHANGGCVDDVIIYKQNAESYFVIVNASNRQKDLDHLKHYSGSYNVSIKDRFSEEGILALQGPKAIELLQLLFPSLKHVKPMRFQIVDFEGNPMIVSGTGYTGAGGVEIYGPSKQIVLLWDLLLEKGKPYEIEPIGLGARDTLRLEKGYALYGHELSDSISPNESVAAWTVHWDKNFLGKDTLIALEKNPNKRSAYGIIVQDRGIAREGCDVYNEHTKIGKVTSGSFSPLLNKSIALILVHGQYRTGDKLYVEVRGQRLLAHVAELPFL